MIECGQSCVLRRRNAGAMERNEGGVARRTVFSAALIRRRLRFREGPHRALDDEGIPKRPSFASWKVTVPENHRSACAFMYSRSRALMSDWYPLPRLLNQASTSASMRNVTCRLGGTGCSPLRATARANRSGVNSGCSDRSMSSSRCASTLRQSVREVFEVEVLLTSGRFPDRNDSDEISGLRMGDGYYPPFQEAQRHEPVFFVGETIILNGERPSREYPLGADEINPVFSEIRPTLGVIPFKSHSIIPTFCNYNKPCCARFVSQTRGPCIVVMRISYSMFIGWGG
jgi:hypothetical protein